VAQHPRPDPHHARLETDLTDQRPNYDQNPTLYPTALALIAIYALIRTIGGQPEDATAIATLAGALLPQIRT
jgi:hypothetical protein